MVSQRTEERRTAVNGSIPPPAERTIVDLPDDEHVTQFIAWTITDEDGRCHCVTMSHKRMFARYLMWTERTSVVPLPEKTLQTLLGKRKGQVTKGRDRLRDPRTAKVDHYATGSPKRETVYTFNPPRKEPARPGKVPVGDVVRAEPQMQPLTQIAA